MSCKKIIKKIAKERGITEAEVEKELLLAMEASKTSNDPHTKDFWQEAKFLNRPVTLEDFLSFSIRKFCLSLHTKNG